MNKEEAIELAGFDEVSKDIEHRIKVAGVRGLSIEKARELGLFNRISMLLCAMHASVAAAYRIYGNIDAILQDFGGRKNDIAQACGKFERAFDQYMSFWTAYYNGEKGQSDMNHETEALYHQIMKWAQLPEAWSLGDEQRTDERTTAAICIDDEDAGTVLRFFESVVWEEVTEEKDSWCVTKMSLIDRRQECVEQDMDKASAMMVAKRMSAEDTESIYTASLVRDLEKKETVVIPYKAYRGNNTVGKIVRNFK